MIDAAPCTQTVSILRALVLGADGACIDLSMPSILGLVVAFMVGVVALKIGARAALGLVFGRRSRAPKADDGPAPQPATAPRTLIGTPDYDGGPIRSSRPR